uniref:Uncharacterized protein n=1 Tax=Opuntia streptacantha TaxID=393608 RepID=A0A7C9ES54_OPUST
MWILSAGIKNLGSGFAIAGSLCTLVSSAWLVPFGWGFVVIFLCLRMSENHNSFWGSVGSVRNQLNTRNSLFLDWKFSTFFNGFLSHTHFYICRSQKNVGSFIYPVFSLSFVLNPVGRGGDLLHSVSVFTHTLDFRGMKAKMYCKSFFFLLVGGGEIVNKMLAYLDCYAPVIRFFVYYLKFK